MQAAAVLAVVAFAAFALRAVGFEHVFTSEGLASAVFDGAYHARLAAWCEANFPAFLTWDPYLNWPHGAPVPWPPLQDWLVAAIARVSGGGAGAVESVLAWTAPVAGAATTLPVYAAARIVAGRGVAVGAAALYAGFGVTIQISSVGDGDHHALVALLGASFLAFALAAARTDLLRAHFAAIALGLAMARAAVVVTWDGSLLYLFLVDGALLLAGAVTGRRILLAVHAAGLVATALAAALVLAAWDVPIGGQFSAVALSRLHVAVMLAAAACAAALAGLEWARPTSGPAARVARLTGLGVVCAASILALPGARESVAHALTFLTIGDSMGPVTLEQYPLLPLPGGRRPLVPPEIEFGWLAWAVPLAPLGACAGARDLGRRVPALVLAGITAVLAALTVYQTRYANDFAPAGAIGFALLLAHVVRLMPGPAAARTTVAIALGALGLAPGLRAAVAGWSDSVAHLRGIPLGRDSLLSTPEGTLVRFAHLVREATPETAGFLTPNAQPEYGVLVPANFGLAIRYHARRPVPADAFWDNVDPANFALATRWFSLSDEAEALAVAEKLRIRYAVTSAQRNQGRGSVAAQLQTDDGNGRGGRPRLEHFRLVTEGPAHGRPSALLGAYGVQGVLYKLFEIVHGAVLVVRSRPGTLVDAHLELVTPTQRRFVHVAEAETGPDGAARLRVPYPTGANAPTRAAGPWRVRAGKREARVEVSEDEVRGGAEIEVKLDGAG